MALRLASSACTDASEMEPEVRPAPTLLKARLGGAATGILCALSLTSCVRGVVVGRDVEVEDHSLAHPPEVINQREERTVRETTQPQRKQKRKGPMVW